MNGDKLQPFRDWMNASTFSETPPGSIEKLFVAGFMKKARGSYFVEAGAVNGFHLSQTATLENDHGWTGLLIEGHPALFELLQEGERKATKAHAVLGTGGPAVFETKSRGMLGQSQLREEIQNEDCRQVETRTLEDLLTEAKAPRVIDFLVLDVEDALPAVWAGVDLDRRNFDFLALEMKKEQPAIMAELSARGYRLAAVMGGEDYIFTK